TGTPGRARWRQACVALEVALALALVANAGLLLKSYVKLRAVDLGFRTDVLAVTLPTSANLRPTERNAGPSPAQAQQQSRIRDQAARFASALATVPGVKQFAIADRAPLSEFAMMFMTNIEGYTPDPAAPAPPLSTASVTPGYFSVLGIPLREGRLLADSDGNGAPAVVVVNEAFARRYFPGQSVVGRRLASPSNPGTWATIVGVVGDTRRSGQDTTPQAQVYFPLDQWPQPRLAAVVRFEGDVRTIASAMLETLRKLEPGLPFDAPITLDERLDRMLAPRALVMGLLLAFASAAVLLAALGIFGVMAYAVAQRTHEFGVRMALGADRAGIIRHVLGGAGAAICLGVAGGIGLSFATSQLLAATLFAVTRGDPVILMAAATGLAFIGLIASLIPALRAARANPVEALRAD
ncbi:MAG: ABC transporter permease, partial [Pseudomonadota bacterium]